jgi:hypothetical protein
MSTLTLLGDLAPVGLTDVGFGGGPATGESALMLANLELPFCASGLKGRAKAGPCLRAEPETLRAITAALPGLVGVLANNHVMDYGVAGLEQTLAALREQGIRHVGAGANLADATAPLIVNAGEVRIGIIAGTDRWFGIATDNRPGVAPLEDMIARIRRVRTEVDRVIVSVHGGSEMSPWPSPRWQRMLRSFVESGADLVHVHHPHVALGWERWGEGWIFYGLGNTIVNPARWPEPTWARRSWRIELDAANLASNPRVSEWEVTAAGAGGCRVSCVRPDVPADAADIVARSRPLSDPALLEGLQQEYAIRLWESFYADRIAIGDTGRRQVRNLGRTLRDAALAAFAPARWRDLRRSRGLFHYHVFSAETHAQEIATALGVLHGELEDRRSPASRELAAEWLPPSLFAG